MKRSQRDTNFTAILPLLIAIAILSASFARGGNLYWDINGISTGATNTTTAPGIWGVDSFWNTISDGTGVTDAYVPGSDVFFSAGTNATGSFAVSVSGAQDASSLTFRNGTIALNGQDTPALSIGIGGITLADGLNGNLTLGTTLNVVLSASQNWTNSTVTAARALVVNSGITGNATAGNTYTLAFTGPSSGATTIAGVVGDGVAGGKVGITQNGSNTLTMNGTVANTYTGATSVNSGTLALDFVNLASATDLINAASSLGLGGGTLTVKGKSTGITSQTFAGLDIGGNATSTISLNPNAGTGTSLTIGNTWTRSTGGTLFVDLSSTSVGTRTVISSPTLTNGILGYGLVKDSLGTGFATVDGSNNLVRYTAATPLVNNTNDSAANTLVTAGLTHDAGDWAVNSLAINTITNNQVLNLGGGKVTLTSGAILNNSTIANTAVTISNGQLGADDSEVIVHQANASSSVTISASISSGIGSLTKDGGGTAILTGTNTYTGNTVIGAGTLQIGGGSTVGSISTSSNVIDNGALTLSRSDAVNFSNTISGTGSFTKSGAGTVTLGVNNTYAGKTTINSGVLEVSSLNKVSGGSSSSSLGAPKTAANGTIQIGQNAQSPTNGTLRYIGSGETTDRALTFNEGSGAVSTLDASGTGPVVFSNTGANADSGTGTSATATFAFTGTNTGNNIFAEKLVDGNSGSGGNNILKSGTGTWVFTNSASSYKKTTTISAGTLIAGADAINKLTPDQSAIRRGEQGTTADPTTHTFTQVGGYLNLVDGDKIVMGAGTAPGGTSNGTTYFVINANGTTFQIATTLGGSAVNFTTAGSSTGFYQIGVFGSASSAITLGNASTVTASAPSLLLGTGTSGFSTNRPIILATTGASDAAYRIGGNSDAINSFSGLVTANQNLTVSQVATTGGNALQVTGGIAGGAGSHTVTFAGPGAINVSGTAISDGAGILGLKVTGGVTTLSAVNTYTGVTTISGGELIVPGSLAGSLSVSVANGATLETDSNISLNDNVTLSLVTGSALDLNFNGGSQTVGWLFLNGAMAPIGSTYTVSDLMTMDPTINFSGSGSLTVSGVPEPSTMAFLILGGMAFFGVRRFCGLKKT